MGILSLIDNPQFGIWYLVFFVVALLVAITVHEFAHAWVANYLGDPTPKKAGRVTLNPVAHLDPLGTIMLFLVRFGWGKPVPINPNNFKNPRLGSSLTAVAGPTSNFLLANLLALIYKISEVPATSALGTFILLTIYLNLILMVFNLLPIPPLDGSKFFALFFPAMENKKFEMYGPFILIVLVLTGFVSTFYFIPISQLLINLLGVPI
jgi:Zn-dependent protease